MMVQFAFDTWFAWYPVRLGSSATGRIAWFEKVQRIWLPNRSAPIYHAISEETEEIVKRKYGRGQ
jgi:hypothetical protein